MLIYSAKYVTLLTFMILVSSGCSPTSSSSGNQYQVGVINLTNEDLEHVVFHSPELNAGFGVVRGKATMGLYSAPLPKNGTLEWTAPNGSRHSVVVTIPSSPLAFDGILWLKIMPNGSVVVVPLSKKEIFDAGAKP